MVGIKEVALSYYSRKDIQKVIFNFCENRETIPSYMMESFGRRPDMLHYPSDILSFVKKGATSFHCSEELWSNPLQISTNLTREQLDGLRIGWDLLIDIDSRYLDYSKIMAELLIQALSFHNIKNIGIKFSGSKGFHIIVPWKAFPEEINNKKTKDMFPEWPRIISLYLSEMIKPKLIERISELTAPKPYIKDEEEAKKVMPDIILVSSRHLFRCPYSLHEKTSLVSVVLDKDEIRDFKPQDASPLKIKVKNFYPKAKEEEARELLVQALDWYKDKEEKKERKKYREIRIDKRKLILPPCIMKIEKGLEDGKKRALFILINFYRSLGLELDEIKERVEEWNKKNKPKLKQNYITSQFKWVERQEVRLPPNCDKDYYKGIGVCEPDELCKIIKNPVNYTVKKQLRKNGRKLLKKKSSK